MAQDINAQTPNPEQTQTILQSIMNGVIITDSAGVVSEFNYACEKMFGHDSDKMIGKSLQSLMPELFSGESDNAFQPVIGVPRELRVPNQHGGDVPIRFTVNKSVETGAVNYVIIIHDLTHRKTLEEAVAASETKLLTMYASSPAACMTVDLETMKITDCNAAAEKMFNTTREAFIGLTPSYFSPVFQDDGRPSDALAMEMIQKTIREGRNHFYWTHTRMTGENFPCEINTCVRELDHRAIFIASVRDMTEQKAVEKELMDAKQEAEKANFLQSRLLANMSHEIRTPLNGIMGISDAITRSVECPELQEQLAIIKECGTDLTVLIDDILTLSKIEADGLDLELVDIDVRELFESVQVIWQDKAGERGNLFQVIVKEGVPSRVLLDPVRVRQCINNLCGNAIKFTENGRIQVIADWIETRKESFLTVRVVDTGCGISEDQFGIIFKPFRQADCSITRKYGGTGLGLSIVKSLTEKMGGGIKVKSKIGQGSAFMLALKADRSEVVQIRKPAEKQRSENPLLGLNILYAEDNDINAYVLNALLGPTGVNLTRAENGVEAVEMAGLKHYDLILMDIQMPIMTGVEACAEIKASNSPNKTTPIIALTANVMPHHQKEYIKVGMIDVCAKPYNLEQIQNCILKALNVEIAA